MTDVLRDISSRSHTPASQRREDVRVAASLPVLVSVLGRAISIPLRTAEISGGGLLLAGAEMLTIEQRLRFALDINHPERAARSEPPIVGAGTVIRIDQRGHRAGKRAIQFDLIEEIERRRLIRLVFEFQRIDRRKRLGRA